MTGHDQPPTAKKAWYKKWWVWALGVLGVVTIGVALSSTPEQEAAAPGSTTSTAETVETTTTATDSSTTTNAPSTTLPATTTTLPATTTTTLPPILAEGSGSGDDVVELDLPDVPVVVEFTYGGSGNFAVWSLDPGLENVDLLVNEIGAYEGTRPMQLNQGEVITGLEITASDDWTYEIRSLLQEPEQTCPVSDTGDSVILLSNFADTAGTADLTHDGDGNFAIWAWGSGVDLLVNDIGPYQGTVKVSAGLVAWDISANGRWTVDC